MGEFKYYIIRRLLTFIPTLLGVIVITFIISHLVPALPAKGAFARHMNPQTLALIKKMYHLDQPWYMQLWYYIVDLFTGNWGTSIVTSRPILKELSIYFPVTFQLAILGEIFILIAGIPLGIIAAMENNTKIDQALRVLSVIGYSVPYFLLAIAFQMIFYYWLGWLPGFGLGRKPRVVYTGMYLFDSLLCGDFGAFIDNLRHFLLPSISLATPGAAVIARLMRGSLLDTLSSDFIDYCKMKGLPERVIMIKHALKNAIIPIITVAGLQFGGLLGGAIITETIFAIAGLGRYLVVSTYAMDYPIIMAGTFLIGLVYLIVNFVVDLLYAYVDPRVRL